MRSHARQEIDEHVRTHPPPTNSCTTQSEGCDSSAVRRWPRECHWFTRLYNLTLGVVGLRRIQGRENCDAAAPEKDA